MILLPAYFLQLRSSQFSSHFSVSPLWARHYPLVLFGGLGYQDIQEYDYFLFAHLISTPKHTFLTHMSNVIKIMRFLR